MEPDELEYYPGDVPVFRPTLEQFSDFAAFVSSIEPQCLDIGLAKVIPPEGWQPRAPAEGILPQKHSYATEANYEAVLQDFRITTPITQEFAKGPTAGVFSQLNLESRSVMYPRFSLRCNSAGHAPPPLSQSPRIASSDSQGGPAPGPGDVPRGRLYRHLERRYWQGILNRTPQYGADLAASLMDPAFAQGWDLSSLHTPLREMPPVSGVNIPYLYFGSWGSTFSWHVEDVDLYSINYLHFGAPKHWYTVSSRDRVAFEHILRSWFPAEAASCREFMRHKTFLADPAVLERRGIKVSRVVQEPGEFMITFPGAYHAGFNHGLNCAEAVNFALPGWLEAGASARSCSCISDSVRVDVDKMKSLFADWTARGLLPGMRRSAPSSGSVPAAPSPVAPMTPTPGPRSSFEPLESPLDVESSSEDGGGHGSARLASSPSAAMTPVATVAQLVVVDEHALSLKTSPPFRHLKPAEVGGPSAPAKRPPAGTTAGRVAKRPRGNPSAHVPQAQPAGNGTDPSAPGKGVPPVAGPPDAEAKPALPERPAPSRKSTRVVRRPMPIGGVPPGTGTLSNSAGHRSGASPAPAPGAVDASAPGPASGGLAPGKRPAALGPNDRGGGTLPPSAVASSPPGPPSAAGAPIAQWSFSR
ncbi:hypothetical protein H696_02875 [Fonticula alba]|uniref:JmjC domain-containing protein n=1 Tax=Fonticula alba TaxID=691883 RepID=A0A058Z8B7_FONAL|nr:hypothetical protein H696_02875 [Fonticula alba]KCV70529.1 hypothetical protein H696_02875 [Fonticula alba]|eukprot:XP_009495045.1 hypothetical protein H696_02875 [Fonticula alba]